MIAPEPLLYSDDTETIPVDEAQDILQVVNAIQRLLQKSLAQSSEYRRDVHVKGHGFARGEFRIPANLPEELSQGLFHQSGIFPAVVRFSNSSPQPQPDAVPDGRGLAIQVKNPPGEFLAEEGFRSQTQDFLMVNHPTFVVANVKDYLRLEQARLAATGSTMTEVLGAAKGLTGGEWNPLDWHWREVLSAAQIVAKFPAHPADTTYFSMAPIRFGKYICKYRVRPAEHSSDSYLQLLGSLASHADAMRLALEQSLRSHDILFDFQVQLRTSTRTMPIEDASVEWPETESPYRTVATLVLPRQDIASSQHHTDCENLSFSVWHALAAHRPLGGINRVRREAYAASYAWRTEHRIVQ